MADHYLQFSIQVSGLTAAERNWLRQQLDETLLEAAAAYQAECDELASRPDTEREATHHRARARYLEAGGNGIEPAGLVLLGHYRQHDGVLDVEHAFGHDCHGGECLWLFAEEHGDPEVVAILLQAFAQRFRPTARFGLTWAATCSKPRAGEFSGGGVVIGAERCDWIEAGDWVEQRLAGMTSEACRRQLAELRHCAFDAIQRHLVALADRRLDLDEAGEAVDLGEPGDVNEHTPRIIAIELDSTHTRIQATVYHPVDVNEESWDATELEEHLSAEDAARLLVAVERVIERARS